MCIFVSNLVTIGTFSCKRIQGEKLQKNTTAILIRQSSNIFVVSMDTFKYDNGCLWFYRTYFGVKAWLAHVVSHMEHHSKISNKIPQKYVSDKVSTFSWCPWTPSNMTIAAYDSTAPTWFMLCLCVLFVERQQTSWFIGAHKETHLATRYYI